jgi:hypothetical protein
MRNFTLVVVAISLCLGMSACGGGSASPSVSTPPGGGGGTLPAGSIQPSFFALDLGPAHPWPTTLGVQFGIWRTLGTLTRWGTLQPTAPAGGPTSNPDDASYDWSNVDSTFPIAIQNGQQILYTAYYSPAWVSQNPTSPCQVATYQNAGGCYPPTDVESGDNYWKSFLTALYNHTKANGWHIDYWECWNEPDIPNEWSGSLTDLNIMCNDLYSTIKALDPTAKFTTPAPTGGKAAAKWLAQWFALPDSSATTADIIAFHGYVCNNINTCSAASAEEVQTSVLAPIHQSVSAVSALSSKPLWDTEGSDVVAHYALSDPDQHAAFYARFTLLQQSAGIATFSYWGWDFGNDVNLVDYPGDDPSATSTVLNTAGLAWQQIHDWTLGSKYTSACAISSGSIYTCGLTNESGVPTLIVWDSAPFSTCSNDVCGSASFTGAANFTQCTDLAGNACTNGISNGTVIVGAKPVLLQ